MTINNFTRDQLFHRHKLSHQQIDDLLGESESGKYPESKAQYLEELHEILVLSDLFKENGIEFVPLKGFLLSWRLYNDPIYRSQVDIDFLIDLPYMDKAIDLLEERGYRPFIYPWPGKKRRRDLLARHNHEIQYFHPGKNIGIDLHWDFLHHLISPLRSVKEQVFDNLVPVQFEGRIFRVLNPEYELLYLVIHGGWHGWNRLKWLVDVNQLLLTYKINEQRFNSLIFVTKSYRLVGLCNALLAEYFPDGPRVPESGKTLYGLLDYSLLPTHEINESKFRSFRNKLKTVLFHLKLFPGFSYKLNLLRIYLFPFDQINNPRIPPLQLCFYLVGPFIKLWKRLR